MEFREVASFEELDRRYAPAGLPADVKKRFEGFGMPMPDMGTSHADSVHSFGIEFPLAAVEITIEIAGTDLRLGPKHTMLPGQNIMQGCWMKGGAVGVQIGDPGTAATGT